MIRRIITGIVYNTFMVEIFILLHRSHYPGGLYTGHFGKEKSGKRDGRSDFSYSSFFVKSMLRNKEEGINQGINKPINGEK